MTTQLAGNIVVPHTFYFPGVMTNTGEFSQASGAFATLVGEVNFDNGRVIAMTYVSEQASNCTLRLWRSTYAKSHTMVKEWTVSNNKYLVHYEHDTNAAAVLGSTFSVAAIPASPFPTNPVVKVYVLYPSLLSKTGELTG